MIRVTFEAPTYDYLIQSLMEFIHEAHDVALRDHGFPGNDPNAPLYAEPQADEPEPDKPEPAVTKEHVRKAMLAVRDKLGSPVLRSLLTSYQANNLDEIKTTDYQAILIAANALLKEAENNG